MLHKRYISEQTPHESEQTPLLPAGRKLSTDMTPAAIRQNSLNSNVMWQASEQQNEPDFLMRDALQAVSEEDSPAQDEEKSKMPIIEAF